MRWPWRCCPAVLPGRGGGRATTQGEPTSIQLAAVAAHRVFVSANRPQLADLQVVGFPSPWSDTRLSFNEFEHLSERRSRLTRLVSPPCKPLYGELFDPDRACGCLIGDGR
jgi:hypothetical protein